MQRIPWGDYVLKDVFYWIEVKKKTVFFDVMQHYALFQGSTKTLRKQAHSGIGKICNFNGHSASREDW
jgi:uncharacterized protein with WD repeat